MPISNFDNTKNLRIVLQSFDQVFEANSSSYANLRAQAWLRDGKDQKSKIFDIKVPAKTNDGIGGINAINSASSEFIAELMKWTGEK
jgi:cholesterol transport system auxiliary component